MPIDILTVLNPDPKPMSTSNKRKHHDSPQAPEHTPYASMATSSISPQAQDDVGTPVAENYPRKRIAIACNVCRFRKTRCDARKPSCGFCTDLGIECTYRKPTVGDRAKPIAQGPSLDSLVNIENRLAQLEARMDSAQQMIEKSNCTSPNTSSLGEMLPPRESNSRLSDRMAVDFMAPKTSLSNPSVSTPKTYDLAFRQTATEATTARPSLLHFRAPPYIHIESWDYTAEFYDDEIAMGDRMADEFDEALNQPIDLSWRTIRRLQQSFVENFLRWTPVFDQRTCVDSVEQATAENFAGINTHTCLTFFLLSLGAVAEDHSNEDLEKMAPGFSYFARGCQILERLTLRTGNLTILQCRVLQASYFKFAICPMQAWNSITQSARDCMHILSSRMVQGMTPIEQEALHRAFWATSTILHELEATMKMHPIGIRQFHETVPLPQFEEEDSGFYFFLAQISLRKLLTQSLEVVGYHSGTVIYAPVVTRELRKQVREWHSHLPAVVRFPLEAVPVFDSRQSFLREQYVALFVVLGWPSVLKIMEYGEDSGVTLDPETLAVTREQAAGCIRACCLVLAVADEQLMGRKMGTHFTLFAAFASLATLIITYNCPALSFVEETKQERHIHNGYEILLAWEHLPVMRRGLERARILMQQAGLTDAKADYASHDTPGHILTPSLGLAIQCTNWNSPASILSGPRT